ncbi:MAG: PadR family transcriptional regulator [Stackebrandtia sp.]
MAKKRKVGNPLALAALSYLLMRPMHPYELGSTLKHNGDDRSIKYNHGSLYMVIRQLDAAGYIAEHETTREGNLPERTVYKITDTGRAELRDWLRELIAEPNHEYPAFVTGLSLISALPPEEATALLRQRLEVLRTQCEEITDLVYGAATEGVHELFLIEEDYRKSILEAEMSFIEKFLHKINDPQSDWARPWAEFHKPPKEQS